MNKCLEIKNLNKYFDKNLIIDNVSFALDEGEILAILGPSGCGKSTILNIISGLEKDYDGIVHLKNNPNISYMFQEDALLNHLNVYKNASLGLILNHTRTISSYKEIDNMLKEYKLINYKDKNINSLSGGMKKRLSLIRALATNPTLLLLDEPFSALDFYSRIRVSDDVLKKIRTKKISTIIITHDIEEAIYFADRIIILTKKPAKIKKVIDVNIDKKLKIMDKRKTEEFNQLLDDIWSVLDE